MSKASGGINNQVILDIWCKFILHFDIVVLYVILGAY